MHGHYKINIMSHVGLSNDAKNQVFCAIIQVSDPILTNHVQDVFTTTFVNSGKFSCWIEVVGSLYILYKSTWQILTTTM
jgi:hypothetical protein